MTALLLAAVIAAKQLPSTPPPPQTVLLDCKLDGVKVDCNRFGFKALGERPRARLDLICAKLCETPEATAFSDPNTLGEITDCECIGTDRVARICTLMDLYVGHRGPACTKTGIICLNGGRDFYVERHPDGTPEIRWGGCEIIEKPSAQADPWSGFWEALIGNPNPSPRLRLTAGLVFGVAVVWLIGTLILQRMRRARKGPQP